MVTEKSRSATEIFHADLNTRKTVHVKWTVLSDMYILHLPCNMQTLIHLKPSIITANSSTHADFPGPLAQNDQTNRASATEKL